jgi:hypothetical protein
MCIYLYVKTHKITGLKYLGKTNSKNPHKYPGSGVYWTDHLKKHGNDVATEILHECKDNDEVRERGLYYSELWNIVDAVDENGRKIWANLEPESGNGGTGWGHGNDNIAKRPDVAEKIKNTRSTPEHKEKIKEINGDLEVKKRRSESQKISQNRQEVKNKRKETTDSDEYKKRVSGDNNILRRSEEAKQSHLESVRSESARESHRGPKNSMNLPGVRDKHHDSVNSPKEKQRRSELVSGKNNPKASTYKFVSPTGETIIVSGELDKFCKENRLSRSMVFKMLNGHCPPIKNSSHGWSVKRINTE